MLSVRCPQSRKVAMASLAMALDENMVFASLPESLSSWTLKFLGRPLE